MMMTTEQLLDLMEAVEDSLLSDPFDSCRTPASDLAALGGAAALAWVGMAARGDVDPAVADPASIAAGAVGEAVECAGLLEGGEDLA